MPTAARANRSVFSLLKKLNPGTFPRTFWYPANYVNRNESAAQRDATALG